MSTPKKACSDDGFGPDHCGHVLLRTGRAVFSWKEVWIWIRGPHLIIYNKSREPIESAVLCREDSVYLLNLLSITGKKHSFGLTIKSRGRDFVFVCSDDAAREQWIETIENSIRAAIPVSAPRTSGASSSSTSEGASSTADGEVDVPVSTHDDPFPRTDRDTFRVCSYNVNFGFCQIGTRPTEEWEITRAMEAVRADVVLLQETTPDWEVWFKEHCIGESSDKFPYSFFHTYEIPEGETRPPAGGIGILSRFPILSTTIIPSPVAWFPALLVEVDVNGTAVQMLNLHLHPPLTPSALPLPHAMITSIHKRERECRHFQQMVDVTRPIIVCGDFNEGHSSPSPLFWRSEMAMRSVLYDFCREKPTWTWTLPLGIQIYLCLDHMFYANVACTFGAVHQAGCSDHFPLFGDFKILRD